MDPTPRIFEFSHSVEMMIFLLRRGSCTKTELYDGVCRSQALPRRLDDLEAAGLLSQESAGRSTVLRLTDRGVRVAELLEEAVAVMRGDERRQADPLSGPPSSVPLRVGARLIRGRPSRIMEEGERLSLPLGIDRFDEIRTGGYYYIDKSELISDIVAKKAKVNLFTRPRRFGKSLNLLMIDCFFDLEFRGNRWFDGLRVTDHPDAVARTGSYPVIHLNLSGLRVDDYGNMFIPDLRSSGGVLTRTSWIRLPNLRIRPGSVRV